MASGLGRHCASLLSLVLWAHMHTGAPLALAVSCDGHLWGVVCQPARTAGASGITGEQAATCRRCCLQGSNGACTQSHSFTFPALQNLASRVMYRLSRARLAGSLLAFSDSTDKAFYRAELKSELHMLQRDYKALLYGGAMVLEVRLQAWALLCTGPSPGSTTVCASNNVNRYACVLAGASKLQSRGASSGDAKPGTGR